MQVSVLQVFTRYKDQFNFDLGGEHGRTALHFAAIHDHDICAKILVNKYLYLIYVLSVFQFSTNFIAFSFILKMWISKALVIAVKRFVSKYIFKIFPFNFKD